MNQNRYVFLDAIRGVAAILILIRHTGSYWHFNFYHSYLGVDLFFILSGFVIAYAYDEKLEKGVINLQNFFLIRLIRLYPVFILSVFFCTVLLVLNLTLSSQAINSIEILSLVAMTALFLPSLVIGSNSIFPMNATYWSLFFELVANFIYAVSRPFLTNIVLGGIVTASGLLIILSSYHHGNLDNGYQWGGASILTGFSRSIFGVFMGLMLHRHRVLLVESFGSFISPWVACFVLTMILISPDFGQFNWILDAFFVVVIFPIAVIFASQGKNTRLEKYFLILGSASYPVYVLHKPIGELFSKLIHGKEHEFAPVSGLILVLVLVAFSVWFEKKYDIPIRKYISNYFFNRVKV